MANYQAVAAQAARRYGIPVGVFLRQIAAESGFNPNARSSAGALGIAQFMPATARGFGIDPLNPVQALNAAAKYDAQLVAKYGSIARALSAYNSGRPDAYRDPGFAGGQTYNYVRKILAGAGGAAPPSLAAARSPAAAPLGGGAPDRRSQLLALINANNQILGVPRLNVSIPALPESAGAAAATAPAQAGQVRLGGKPTGGVNPAFERAVEAAARAAGATRINVTSGYRTPQHNAAVGGVQGSLHTRGLALDGYGFVPGRGWVPLGALLKGVAARYGIRSGDVPGFFNGAPDPVHVDAGR